MTRHRVVYNLAARKRAAVSEGSTDMSIRQRMRTELKRAMQARDKHQITMLRSLLSAVDNAEAVDAPTGPVPITGHTPDVPRRQLSEEQIIAILQREADEHRAALAKYEQLGQAEEAARLRAELDVVESLLNT